MEARWGREGEAEREKAASANVTGLHSDVGVQRLHRRASCTNVHARAHTVILGVRRPLPVCKTVTNLAIRSPRAPRSLATAPSRRARHAASRCGRGGTCVSTLTKRWRTSERATSEAWGGEITSRNGHYREDGLLELRRVMSRMAPPISSCKRHRSKFQISGKIAKDKFRERN